MFRLGPPSSHLRTPKLVVTLFVILPLAVVVLFSCLVVVGGIVSTISSVRFESMIQEFPFHLVFLLVEFVSLWYVYAMVVSLWWDRRQASISFGLVFGLILVTVCVVNVGNDLLKEYEHGVLRRSSIAYGYLFFSNWLLTVGLLLHAMYGRRRV